MYKYTVHSIVHDARCVYGATQGVVHPEPHTLPLLSCSHSAYARCTTYYVLCTRYIVRRTRYKLVLRCMYDVLRYVPQHRVRCTPCTPSIVRCTLYSYDVVATQQDTSSYDVYYSRLHIFNLTYFMPFVLHLFVQV